MKCDSCGKELEVGQWPFCGGDPSKHQDARNFGEKPMEPYWDEHISPEGALITTRAERRNIMYANKLEYHDVSKKRRGRIFVDMGKR